MFLYTLKGKTIASIKEKSCIQSEVMTCFKKRQHAQPQNWNNTYEAEAAPHYAIMQHRGM